MGMMSLNEFLLRKSCENMGSKYSLIIVQNAVDLRALHWQNNVGTADMTGIEKIRESKHRLTKSISHAVTVDI